MRSARGAAEFGLGGDAGAGFAGIGAGEPARLGLAHLHHLLLRAVAVVPCRLDRAGFHHRGDVVFAAEAA